MRKILYIRLSSKVGNKEDGGDIYDRKTIEAIRRTGAELKTIEVVRKRSISLPFWALTPDQSLHERLAAARKEGVFIIFSHESLFSLMGDSPVDALIVHNYFPAFSFESQRLLQVYYRLAARAYFARYFKLSRCIIFLSARDRREAVTHTPAIQEISHILPPPPHRAPLLARRTDLIHVSGSENWLPKRLSRLTKAEIAEMNARGFAIQDFGVNMTPAFGLITDRFAVGFKLKLMQMIYCKDIIASMSDIEEDLRYISPSYPFYRKVGGVSDALDYFEHVASSNCLADIDAACDLAIRDCIISWDQMATLLLSYVSRP